MTAQSYDAAILGGGPAGLMAAGTAGRRGKRVLLLDKNPAPGKKLGITGKGRCNVTNLCPVAEAVRNIPRGGRFLYGALSRFSPEDTVAFFEGLGVPLKTERGRRVFPVSDRAADVVRALTGYALTENVDFLSAEALSVLPKAGGGFRIRTKRGDFSAPSVLIATGGASYPGTGSTGDGYRLAKALGHEVVPIGPSLVPLVAKGDLCPRLQGLSLRNCGVTVTKRGAKKPIYEDFGELLFTHFGLSGPTVLSASAHLRPMAPGEYTFHIDLKPALSEEKLDARLVRELSENRNRFFLNALDSLLPQKLIPEAVRLSGVPGDARCHSVTREQRAAFRRVLKDLTIEIEGFRPIAEAIVTTGGVALSEVDPRTMGSKRVPGLFFAGEVLDADAYTGGYNLQIAFSTGRLAGEHL